MPMNRERYPENWEAISLAIRERAGWKCEICGAPNGVTICRNVHDPAAWRELTEQEAADLAADVAWDRPHWHRPIRVILTVHHVGVPYPDGTPGDPHDKMDVRPENLQALCQRCHLYADLPLHIANAHRTRRARKVEAGQMELWGDTDAHH